MSKRIRAILISTISLLLIGGCNSTNIPKDYLRNPKDAAKSIAGSWIEISRKSAFVDAQVSKLSGELIAVQSDTLYVLSEIKLSVIETDSIGTARLYIFKNQGGKYALITGLLLVPNIIGAMANGGEYAGEFIQLAIPLAVTGITIAIIEGTSKNNQLNYPAYNSIEEFRKFARFPTGIPQGVDKSELHLINTK
jgi:hypothetical protein